jgi:hypothetical protein
MALIVAAARATLACASLKCMISAAFLGSSNDTIHVRWIKHQHALKATRLRELNNRQQQAYKHSLGRDANILLRY